MAERRKIGFGTILMVILAVCAVAYVVSTMRTAGDIPYSELRQYFLEEKVQEYLDQQGGTISPDQSSFTVPEGCLFFLGDNRSGSNDARYWEESYIPVGNVKARVLLAISLTGGSSWQGVRAIG